MKIRFAVPLALALFVTRPRLRNVGKSITMFTPIKGHIPQAAPLTATSMLNLKRNVNEVPR